MPIRVIVFPGPFNWPIFVAQEKGFFAADGIAVELTPTPDSKRQMAGLIDGDFDIAMTGFDNVVAYVEGQGAAEIKDNPDLIAFMGIDNGFLRLMAVPEVQTFADLAGRSVGVDALTTGYAFVLRKMLEIGGLSEGEVNYVESGGVRARLEALLEKKIAATLLISPLEIVAEKQGCIRLGNALDMLGAYHGVVGTARRDWAAGNRETVVGYIRALRAGLDWLYDPTNKTEAIRILAEAVPPMAHVAETSYDILLDPENGFFRDARIDMAGAARVLELRSEYGTPQKLLTDPTKYIDLSYYTNASD